MNWELIIMRGAAVWMVVTFVTVLPYGLYSIYALWKILYEHLTEKERGDYYDN